MKKQGWSDPRLAWSSYIQIYTHAVYTDAYSGSISYAMVWKFTKVIPGKEEE